jgi:hypothetical protein
MLGTSRLNEFFLVRIGLAGRTCRKRDVAGPVLVHVGPELYGVLMVFTRVVAALPGAIVCALNVEGASHLLESTVLAPLLPPAAGDLLRRRGASCGVAGEVPTLS